jgi:hypothetical protein
MIPGQDNLLFAEINPRWECSEIAGWLLTSSLNAPSKGAATFPLFHFWTPPLPAAAPRRGGRPSRRATPKLATARIGAKSDPAVKGFRLAMNRTSDRLPVSTAHATIIPGRLA